MCYCYISIAFVKLKVLNTSGVCKAVYSTGTLTHSWKEWQSNSYLTVSNTWKVSYPSTKNSIQWYRNILVLLPGFREAIWTFRTEYQRSWARNFVCLTTQSISLLVIGQFRFFYFFIIHLHDFVGCIIIKMYPFILGYPTCWCIFVHRNILWSFVCAQYWL